MLIKWGSIVVEGSGKLGGHVFYKGKGDAVIRTLARARNPQTRSQQTIKSRFTKLTQDWSNLTDDQRQSWNEATSSFSRKNRFGDTVLLTGKNLYNALNQQLLISEQPMLSFAPVPKPTPVNILQNVIFRVNAGLVILAGDFTNRGVYVIMSTGVVSKGSSESTNKLRIIDIGSGASNNTSLNSIRPIYDEYVLENGIPKVGDKIIMACYGVNEVGQRTPLAQLATIVIS